MIRNFLLVAFRNTLRNRTYFLVSVGSLSVGIAAVLILFVDVQHELSFDKFHSHKDRIVRINSHFSENEISRTSSRTPFPLKGILLQDFPEVEAVARFAAIAQSRSLLNYEGTVNYEDIYFADPELLKVFDFSLLHGDKETALNNPNSIVLTEKTALRYFGEQDPMGKTLRFQNDTDLTVTGIMKELPVNSHIQFDVLMPVEFQRIRWKIAQNNFYDFEEDWLWNGTWTYLLLREGTNVEAFAAKVAGLPAKYYPEATRAKYSYELQELPFIHFSEGVTGTPTPNGSMVQISSISVIGILILIIAAINFTNLTTAQAPGRSKEVGLRKTMGAYRFHVILQFLCETFIVAVISLIVGLVLAELALPVYSKIVDKELTLNLLDVTTSLYLAVGLVCLSVCAGFYPAAVLSKPNPGKALKGILEKGNNSVFSLRSGLVVFQLTVSIVLISGILIVQKQVNYIRGKDLGFDKSHIVTIKNGQSFAPYRPFKERLLQESGVEDVYRGYFPGALGWVVTWTVEGKPEPMTIPVQMIDENFVPMFGLSIVAGRDFVHGNNVDTLSALINEKMANDMGWTNEEALGRSLSYTGGNDNKTLIALNVVGVVRNANLESLYKPVQAMVFQQSPWGDIAVKISGDPARMLQIIESTFKELAPGWPFEYGFLDEDIRALYHREETLANTIQYFGVLAILISGSGLLALCSFITRQRIKEVAIRKVHGATTTRVVLLLGRYFITLGVVSLLIAVPVSYYFSRQWLQNFVFAIKPGLTLYLETAGILMILILAGITYHILRASSVNPAAILKSE